MPALVGLRSVYYAVMKDDGLTGASYYAPKPILGAMVASINPNSSTETLFGDDGPMESATTLGKIEVELGMTDLPLAVQAELLGHTLSGGVIERKAGDTPPWVALGFKTLKSNGSYRYIWLSKGKFAVPEQKHETKKESVAFQTPTIMGSFVKRDYDDMWQTMADEDADDYVSSTGTNWFTGVDYGRAGITAATSATVVVDPANGEGSWVVSDSLTATFSETIDEAAVTSVNFVLVKVATGAPVACTLSLDVTDKIVTINPDSALDAASMYKLTIKAIVGLAADEVVYFTTA